MKMIRAIDIHKQFSGVEVLKGISLEVEKGEVVAIIGPSGSGKSTFLRCLNRLEHIDSGLLEIEGEQLAGPGPGGAGVGPGSGAGSLGRVTRCWKSVPATLPGPRSTG